MRQTLSISLPDAMVKMVKSEVKQGQYTTASEFIRHLLRLWQTQQLSNELLADRQAFAQGKGKVIKSLAELK